MGNNNSSITHYLIAIDTQIFEISFFQMRVVAAPRAIKFLIGRSSTQVKMWVDNRGGTFKKINR